MRDGWIILQTFSSELEAQAACSLLEARGLQALVEGDNCGGMRPHFDYTSGVKLLVPEEDAVQAQELILAKVPPKSGDSWLCIDCGENIEAGFGTCWKCGRDRD